ncbi:MAG: sn-glycerol-3-phosphate ABC transporter ATP-binding protein UgpC [Elusimicrobiales bacterium]|nr:sn-glycerol-3-phosphate ABC transporter ATP-binding protein UgpC [Elusimicrobiales bacterium]
MASVRFENIVKRFKNNTVLNGVNVDIKDKEFLVIVGPSGCGKSTLLRMLAGLETVTDGNILIDGERVNEYHPSKRNIAMVFQDYALYPHMTVKENMSFSLKLKKTPQDEIESRVKEAASTLQITQYLERKPAQLSGGQRQRVAIGRAIVRKPKVFLFDEPLSNLDAKLREEMRVEIAKLHQRLNATILYVTHDQVEAMTLADRIVIMFGGKVQQEGTPMQVYSKPNNLFVAGFIGSPTMNFLHGKASVKAGKAEFVSKDVKLDLPAKLIDPKALKDGQEIVVGVRPDDIYVDVKNPEGFTEELEGRLDVSELLGHRENLYIYLGDTRILANTDAVGRTPGSKIKVRFNLANMHVFDKETEKRISK